MSGAHCIDFYNKSTLTFIVFIFVSHRAFSSTAKTSAESFAAAVCSCRALWGGSEFLGLPLGVAWVKLHPLEPCSALQAVRERGLAAPALTAWILRGEGATTGTVHSLPVSAPSAECIGVVSVSMRISSLQSVLQQLLLFVARKHCPCTLLYCRGCFFSEPNWLYFIVCCCEFIESDDQGF